MLGCGADSLLCFGGCYSPGQLFTANVNTSLALVRISCVVRVQKGAGSYPKHREQENGKKKKTSGTPEHVIRFECESINVQTNAAQFFFDFCLFVRL